MTIVSNELLLALTPERTYRRLLASSSPAPGSSLLRRLAMVLLVISVMVPIMAVNRVTLGLVATTAVSLAFVLAVQLAAALALIATANTRQVDLRRALDLWFAGHLPYSLWMLIAFPLVGSATFGPITAIAVSATIPAGCTARIACAFCRTVLQTSPAGARWRAAAHFFLVYTIGLMYVAWSAGRP